MQIKILRSVALPWVSGALTEGEVIAATDPRVAGKAKLLVTRGYAEVVADDAGETTQTVDAEPDGVAADPAAKKKRNN